MNHETRIRLAYQSLMGLSVGDAFGQQFFLPEEEALGLIESQQVPSLGWVYTDDTLMAASVFEVLSQHEEINQDELARSFWMRCQPERGYGATMRRLLREISEGADWRVASRELFSGMGSHGNGAAMRVPPLGAYFSDDLERVVEQARASAEVTHTHPEGIGGAIAIAVASALACRVGLGGYLYSPNEFLEIIHRYTPSGLVRQRIETAIGLPDDASLRLAATALGNGVELSAVDTVPFCLWVCSRNLHSYEDALWRTVSAFGDRDTTCAIVGGIVGLSDGVERIPQTWLRYREPLPEWVRV